MISINDRVINGLLETPDNLCMNDFKLEAGN